MTRTDITIDFQSINKEMDKKERQKKKLWKKALKGEEPLILCESFRTDRINWIMASEVKQYDDEGQTKFSIYGYVNPKEKMSVDPTGTLARELEKIKKERLSLIKKEQRILRRFYALGKVYAIDKYLPQKVRAKNSSHNVN